MRKLFCRIKPHIATFVAICVLCTFIPSPASAACGSHYYIYGEWETDGPTQHHRYYTCAACGSSGYDYSSHTPGAPAYSTYNETQHKYTITCTICEGVITETYEAHRDDNNNSFCDVCSGSIHFVVTWDAGTNGGRIYGKPSTTTTVQSGSALSAPDTPTKLGCHFTGWYTTPTGEKLYSTSPITANTTFYAQYSANQYNIVWFADGASCTTSQTFGSAITLPPSPVKSGHTFLGWFTDTSARTQVTPNTLYTTAGESTYYARFSTNTYPIFWNKGDGTSITTNQTYGSNVILPSAPAKPGFSFVGWYTAVQGGSKITSSTIYNTAGQSEYYARFVENGNAIDGETPSGVNIPTLNMQSTIWHKGDGTTETISQQPGQTIRLPADPLKPGYSFTGWYTSETGGSRVNSTTTFQSNSTSDYYAQYRANEYVITWDWGNGNFESTLQLYDAPVVLPSTSSPVDPSFLGWYTDPSGGVNVAEFVYSINSATTFYAHYGNGSCTVNWIADDFARPSNQEVNKPLIFPPQPQKTGYHFSGWFTAPEGGDRIAEGTICTGSESITYYAQWIRIFSITVPTELPVPNGTNSNACSSSANITSYSFSDIKVTSLTVTAGNGWTLVPAGTSMENRKKREKLISLNFNGLSTSLVGSSESFILFEPWLVLDNRISSFPYNLELSTTSKLSAGESILSVVMIVEWAD